MSYTPNGQIPGTNTNDNAIPGDIGEVKSVQRVFANRTSLTNNTAANIIATTLDIGPGQWRLSAMNFYFPAATTVVSLLQGGISSTTATLPSIDSIGGYVQTSNQFTSLGNGHALVIPSIVVNVAAGTIVSYFLVTNQSFSTSTMDVCGWLQAERTR